ncbi:MAG: hypothetical protein LBB49_00805 [Gracilibacteraceae bacterium]|jgi:succinate dehydrogenase/fumarate reductase flavoprotein subunit|nr:hypothetical protein [Gracilibacteraceae bacterium]
MTKEEMLQLADLIDSRLEPIKGQLSSIDTRLMNVERTQETMDKKLTKLQLKVENDIQTSIKITQDGHKDLTRKIDAAINIEERVQLLEADVSAIKLQNRQQQN